MPLDETPKPPIGKSDAFLEAWQRYGAILAAEQRVTALTVQNLALLARLYHDVAEFDAAIEEKGVLVDGTPNPMIRYRDGALGKIISTIKLMGFEGKRHKPHSPLNRRELTN